jgi:hypothetical protein
MKVKKVKTEEMGISHKRPEIIVGIDFGTTYSGYVDNEFDIYLPPC